MKLTKNEKYLLTIIAFLRGNASDSWGRLNALAERRETIKQAAAKGELKELLGQLERWGAGLPHPNDPHLTSKQKAKMIRKARLADEIYQAEGRMG